MAVAMIVEYRITWDGEPGMDGMHRVSAGRFTTRSAAEHALATYTLMGHKENLRIERRTVSPWCVVDTPSTMNGRPNH